MDTNETKVFIALLMGIFVLVVLMTFFVITIIRYQRKKAAFHEQKIRKEIHFLDKERERIAFDLHDDLGASLSAIKLRLQMIPGLNTESNLIIENSEMLIDEVMQKLRRISLNMMPRILQRLGLDEALKELIGLMVDSTSISVNYQYSVDYLAPDRAIHLYMIAQETLNNIIKHSKADTVSFTIHEIKNKIELNIKDNGIGFNKKEVIKKAGMGLHNIAARAQLLNAKMYLTTSPGIGVDYLIEIPAYDKNKSNHCR